MSIKGKFITFEGTDGAGKTTQINAVLSFLEEQGIDYISTREPGGTFVSEKLREVLLHKVEEELEISTELLLMIAARIQHINIPIISDVCSNYWMPSR